MHPYSTIKKTKMLFHTTLGHWCCYVSSSLLPSLEGRRRKRANK